MPSNSSYLYSSETMEKIGNYSDNTDLWCNMVSSPGRPHTVCCVHNMSPLLDFSKQTKDTNNQYKQGTWEAIDFVFHVVCMFLL